MAAGSESSVIVRFLGEDSSLRRSLRELQALARKTQDGFKSMGDKASPAFAKVAAGARVAATALKLLAIGGAAQHGISLIVGAVTQLSGAALLLPAAISVAGAALGTFKLATSGFGDAVKKGGEDLAKLSPQARDTAVAIRGLQPEFEKLRKSVQDKFFTGFSTDVKALAKDYFPILKQRLPEIAAGFNAMGRNAAAALRRPEVKDSIDQVLSNTAKLLQGMPHALGNFAAGFAILAGAGSKHLTPIGGMIEKISDKFNHWADGFVKSGAFDAAVKNAEAGFKDLWDVAKNVGTAIGEVWTALQAGSAAADRAAGGDGQGGPLGFLKNLSKALADTFAKPEIQAGIKALGQAMADVSGAAGGALLTLINGLVPLFVQLQPLVTSVAQFLGTVLRDAFAQLGPSISEFLKWFVPWVDRQLPKLADIISTYVLPAIGAFIDYLNNNKQAVKEVVTVLGIVGAVFLALSTPIITVGLGIMGLIALWIEFRGVVVAAGKFILDTISMIIGGIGDFFDVLSHIPGAAGTGFGAARDGAYKARDAIDAMTGAIHQLPPKNVAVTQHGAERGTGDVQKLKGSIDALRDKTVYINYVVQGAGSFIPKRAVGGTVNKGKTYLVGERGPELMTMPGSGSITPNHRMAAAGGGSSSGGARTVEFVGDTTNALASLIMKMVREDKIRIV